MLFNSVEFAIFLPLVFLLYWFAFNKDIKLQNLFILIVSYAFYGWWDWRFLSLIAFSSTVDYLVGLQFGKTEDQRKRKLLLGISLIVNLGMLGFFKYYNFFAESLVSSFSILSIDLNVSTLKVILPVGISFYTFQTLSYSIDIYRRKLQPTKDAIAFFAFVSFFPQLVAGPIERASNLLPQFFKTRVMTARNLAIGSRLIVWGMFKKVCVADNLGIFVNQVYGSPGEYTGLVCVVATVFFAFQIYCDFSGYSDIAIGTARLLGFRLMTNFKTPYFSQSIREFWGRWHISLSTWFRDYVYIPLGGSRVGVLKWQRNLIITFLVSGLWHGANWTFVVWGGIHGLANSIEALNRKYGGLKINIPIINIIYTFTIVCVSWVFFRAGNLAEAFLFLKNMFVLTAAGITNVVAPYKLIVMVSMLGLMLFFEIIPHYSLFKTRIWKYRTLRWSFYYLLIILLFVFGRTSETEFIYFQF